MQLSVTIDLFSGRPNPSMVLSDADSKALLKRISFGRFKKLNEESEPFPSLLGYRGIIIEQFGKKTATNILLRSHYTMDYVYADNMLAPSKSLPDIESFVLDRLNLFEEPKGFRSFKRDLKRRIEYFWEKCPRWRDRHRKIYPELLIDFYKKIRFKSCYCAPLPDLAAWNTNQDIQWDNNCYNYGTNYRTDTYAQPGEATGSKYTDLSACSVPAGEISARMGAVSDGLIALPSNNNTCPVPGHLVALVVAPDSDYHWYRKGRNGKWSHKMGWSPATLLDDSGNPINDPRTADRGDYTDFCTFMQVIHGRFKIK